MIECVSGRATSSCDSAASPGRVSSQAAQLQLAVRSVMASRGAGSDSHAFASLVQVAVSVGAADKLEDLRLAGIRSAAQLSTAPRSQLRALLGDIVLDRLLQPAGTGAARGPVQSRSDLPVVHPYARGSMQRVSLEGHEGSFDAVDDAFLEDRYAKTSRAPIESRWKTWQRLCAARSLDPLPLTQEKIFKVGALLKEGKYRSSAQYFSVAKQRHREADYAWTDALDLAVQQAVRSVSRGLGPARPKRDLFVDRAPSDLNDQLLKAYERLQVPVEHQFAEPCAVLAVALWFLLRGIEVANVRLVRLSLPVSKTDPSAKGCERSHVCICRPVHAPGCRSRCPPEVMFTQLQTCSCTGGRQALCPFHGALRLAIGIRQARRWSSDTFLCSGAAIPPSKRQVARLAQVAGFCLHNDASEDWMLSQIEDWAEHAFRVAGAQFTCKKLSARRHGRNGGILLVRCSVRALY